VDDQKSTLIQNLSFKLWVVNVWDFYSSSNFLNSTCADKITELQRAEAEKKARKACEKLANIIQINTTISEHKEAEKLISDSLSVRKMKKRSSSLSLAANIVRDSKKSDYLCKKLYSRLNVITELNEVKITLSHPKVLFLLRMLDIVDLFGQQLKQDTENTFKYKLNSSGVDPSSSSFASVTGSPSSSVKDKNNNTSSSPRQPRKLTRINSTNLADWFINGIIDDKLDESFMSLKSQESGCGGGGEEEAGEVVSVNLAVHVNSVEIELSINDLVKEPIGFVAQQESYKQRVVFHNCSAVNDSNAKESLHSVVANKR
jgi:hypothetical protein